MSLVAPLPSGPSSLTPRHLAPAVVGVAALTHLVEALVAHPGDGPAGATELGAEHGLVGESSVVQVTALQQHQDQDDHPQHEGNPTA